MPTTRTITARIHDHLHDGLIALATDRGETLADCIREALAVFVDGGRAGGPVNMECDMSDTEIVSLVRETERARAEGTQARMELNTRMQRIEESLSGLRGLPGELETKIQDGLASLRSAVADLQQQAKKREQEAARAPDGHSTIGEVLDCPSCGPELLAGVVRDQKAAEVCLDGICAASPELLAQKLAEMKLEDLARKIGVDGLRELGRKCEDGLCLLEGVDLPKRGTKFDPIFLGRRSVLD